MRNETPVIRQLPLAFEPTDDYGLDCFLWNHNTFLRDHLLNPSSKELFFYIWGPAGVGKSHLLQACCLAVRAPQTAVYLPLKILAPLGSAIVDGVEHQNLIAIDDIDTIAGDEAWEEQLFHLINMVRQHPGTKLLISNLVSPAHSFLRLPDLKSRLHWGLASQLMPLQDEQKIQVLQHHANKRGFELPKAVGAYLMKHVDRDMHALIQLLRTLDQASLAEQRKITIPFVRHILSQPSTKTGNP